MHADAFELEKLDDLALDPVRRRRGRVRLGLSGRDDGRRHLRFNLGDVGGQCGQAPAFADELRPQLRRNRKLRQTLQPIRRRRVEIANPLGEQQPLHPVAVRRPFLDQPFVLTMRAFGVLFLRRGDHDHPTGVALAPHEARERAHQLVDVHAVRLDPARPTIHRDARRIDLIDLVSRRGQRAMQPVAVAASLKTDMDPDRNAGAPLFASRHAPQQRQEPVQVAAIDLMSANRPLLRRADPDKPLRSAQFQCDENRRKLMPGDGRNLLNKHG